MAKSYQGKIPFRINGNGVLELLTYDIGYKDTKLIDNYVFKDTLCYISYDKGRSSITFKFNSITDKTEHYMFLSDMDNILQLNLNVKEVFGYWTFVKRGANYGIKFLGTEIEKLL